MKVDSLALRGPHDKLPAATRKGGRAKTGWANGLVVDHPQLAMAVRPMSPALLKGFSTTWEDAVIFIERLSKEQPA